MPYSKKIIPTTAINTRNVPKPLHGLFKAYCARHGYTMESAVIALVRMAVKNDMLLRDARKAKNAPIIK